MVAIGLAAIRFIGNECWKDYATGEAQNRPSTRENGEVFQY